MGLFSKKETREQWEIDLEEKEKNAWKNVILTTTETIPNKKVVKIIGLAREWQYDDLRKEAIRMKGDAVIAIRSSNDVSGGYKLLGTVVLLEDI